MVLIRRSFLRPPLQLAHLLYALTTTLMAVHGPRPNDHGYMYSTCPCPRMPRPHATSPTIFLASLSRPPQARSSGSLGDLYSRNHEAAADTSVQQPSAMNGCDITRTLSDVLMGAAHSQQHVLHV